MRWRFAPCRRHRSKAVIAILAAGLNSLSDSTQSKTDEIQVLKQVLQEAIAQEVKVTVQQELADVRQALDKRIDFLEEQVRNDGGLVPVKLEVLAKHLEKIERAIASIGYSTSSLLGISELDVQQNGADHPVKL